MINHLGEPIKNILRVPLEDRKGKRHKMGKIGAR